MVGPPPPRLEGHPGPPERGDPIPSPVEIWTPADRDPWPPYGAVFLGIDPLAVVTQLVGGVRGHPRLALDIGRRRGCLVGAGAPGKRPDPDVGPDHRLLPRLDREVALVGRDGPLACSHDEPRVAVVA